jgi:hypothetical protein
VAQYLVLVPGELSQHIFDVVALGAVINEVVARRAFRQVLEPTRVAPPAREGAV